MRRVTARCLVAPSILPKSGGGGGNSPLFPPAIDAPAFTSNQSNDKVWEIIPNTSPQISTLVMKKKVHHKLDLTLW